MNGLSIEGRVRADILSAALSAGKTGAHVAPSLSLVEIALAALREMDSEKDLFVLSKGHGALGYYAAMHQLGLITDEQFASFEVDGGEFPGQPSRSPENHVVYSGGSLGMGLSYGAGRVWAESLSGLRAYVVLGDGELNEGSIWETAALAGRLGLGGLIAIVDNNGLQSDGRCEDIMRVDYVNAFESFGWKVVRCDGHSIDDLARAFEEASTDEPLAVIAATVKGKGVSFMENNNEWHHHELKQQQYDDAVAELEARYGLR